MRLETLQELQKSPFRFEFERVAFAPEADTLWRSNDVGWLCRGGEELQIFRDPTAADPLRNDPKVLKFLKLLSFSLHLLELLSASAEMSEVLTRPLLTEFETSEVERRKVLLAPMQTTYQPYQCTNSPAAPKRKITTKTTFKYKQLKVECKNEPCKIQLDQQILPTLRLPKDE